MDILFPEPTATILTTTTDLITLNTFFPIRSLFRILIILFCTITIAVANDPENYETLDGDVINLPVGKFPEPECKYRVRLGDRNGPELKRRVEIGEVVYHHWTCSYGQQRSNLYCIFVNNCTVANSRPGSQPVPIIDEFGCSLFPSVLPNVEYSDDLDGGLRTNAFSLDVDEPAVTFNCNIKLLLKRHGICGRPQCIPVEWYLRRSQTPSFFFK